MSKIKITPEFSKKYKMLNKEQKRAVDAIEGPVMVIAGPGTGKTQILTLRIANILRKTDTPADAVLALTFTESAAANMKKRLVSMIGPEGYKVRVQTFHGFANSVIQDYPDDFERFVGASAATDIERLLLLGDLLDEHRDSFKELTPFDDRYKYLKDIMSAISNLKRDAVLPKDFQDWAKKEEENFYAREDVYNKKSGKIKTNFRSHERKLARSKELSFLYELYESEMQKRKLYDFEDMILEVVKKMRQDKDFKLELQENFLYVLADEHQDANDAQNALLELLTDFHESPNLFIVGDEKQAIYRFQGASLNNFLYFKDKFSKIEVVELQDSYRSGQEILDASHSLMEHSPDKIKRVRLRSKGEHKSAELSLKVYSDDEKEALLVAKQIRNLLDEGVEPQEVAIIYRTNADADIFARALAKEGVPFNIESDANALSDKDIHKFLTLLDAIADFGNDEKLARALHLDFLQIDELDIYKVTKAFRKEKSKSLHEILLDEKFLQSLNLKEAKKLSVFAKRLKKYAKRGAQDPLPELVNDAMSDFGFLAYALALPRSLDVLEKLRALVKDAEAMSRGNLDYNLPKFMEHIALLKKHKLSINKAASPHSRAVKLYTAHKAKGLEFEYVFLVRAYDGKWGSRKNMDKFLLPVKSTSKDEQDADERRLFFVALTRAKIFAQISYGALSESGSERLPSKFISEIDKKFINEKDARQEEAKLSAQDFLASAPSGESLLDKDFLRKLFVEHGLSVTAINNFLDCPWNYFYSNLIRIPKMQTKYMLLGNAVHAALALLHQDAQKGKAKSKKDYEEFLEDYIRARASSAIVFESTLALAKEYFFDWWQEYSAELGVRKVFNEYRIDTELSLDLPELPKVRLTGILDKLEFLDEKRVVVTDFKTGKPKTRNDILGNTKSSNGDYFRQLVFYKLLLELEGKYEMQEGVIDFVQRKDNGQMIRESFEVTGGDLEKLKEEIHEVSQKIYKLDFWNSRCDKHSQGKCEYCELRDLMG